jgi:predicted molibdopterin-dependent oxidoreductase YjgC
MEYRNVLTVCPYCGTGCSLYLQVLDGEVVGTLPVKGHAVSEGALCVKGWNAHGFIHHPDRLTEPLIREQDGFREASWDEAYNFIAQKLSAARDEPGPGSIAVLASAKCTNEENYLLQKFTRAVLGTNNVDHCARL